MAISSATGYRTIRRLGRQDGFTLVEMMVAIVILAVGLLGLAKMQLTAIHGNVETNSRAVASSLAQQIYEDVVSKTGDDPIFAAAVTDADWPDSPVIDVVGGGSYAVKYSTVLDYNGVSQLTKVDISVESVKDIHMVSGMKQAKATVTTLKRIY